MSRPGRVARAGLSLAVAGLLAGCLAPAKSETERPSGPSERYESATPDPFSTEGMTEAEAEQAAKVAAAQKVLEKVKDRDPEEERKKMARSRTISAQARAKLGKGAHTEAVQLARDALKVHEQNVDAMLVVAEVYYKEGKYELTRAVSSSALQVDAKIRTPADTSRAYNLQGFAMLAMGEPNAATQSFKKAAEADDKNAAAWNNLGTRYLDAGDVATATACFKYAIELDPRFYKAQLNYGASLRAERKWQDAEAAIGKALKLRPNYAEAYFNLGVLYLDADPFPGLDTTQRLNKAIQNLGKYRELAVGDTSTPLDAGTVGLGGAGGAKAPPPRVSKDRADDYIRVAKKGLEREARRLEREKGRKTETKTVDPTAGAEPAGADDPETGETADAESPGSDAPTPQGPATQSPGSDAPTPQGPGTQSPGSDAPTPQGPGTQSPSKPAPSQPTPSQPAPSQPAPSKPAPSKPAPSKPAPSKPAPTQPPPSQPAPSKPAPTQPPPSKPAPSKPAPTQPPPSQPAPKQPAPQKPSVQKPQSASWDGPAPSCKKVPSNPASRGTRWSPSTLNSMETGASASPCVELVLMSSLGVRPSRVRGTAVAHDHRSSARSAGSHGSVVSSRSSLRLG